MAVSDRYFMTGAGDIPEPAGSPPDPSPPPVGVSLGTDAFRRGLAEAARRQPMATPPQPTTPGPYHAVVRGPDGLDVNISGSAGLVGAQLVVLGQQLAKPDTAGPAYRATS